LLEDPEGDKGAAEEDHDGEDAEGRAPRAGAGPRGARALELEIEGAHQLFRFPFGRGWFPWRFWRFHRGVVWVKED
jgi:hypothetical protein